MEYKYTISFYFSNGEKIFFARSYLIEDNYISFIGKSNDETDREKLQVVNLKYISSFSIEGDKEWMKNLTLEMIQAPRF